MKEIKSIKPMKVRVVRYLIGFTKGKEYEFDGDGLRQDDGYNYTLFLHSQGDTYLEKWENYWKHTSYDDLFAEVEDTMDARDNNKLFEFEKEPCDKCGKYKTYEGHDGCLGELMGLANACCGHGDNKKAYVQFLDGTGVYGDDAIEIQKILKRNTFEKSKIDKVKFLSGSVKFYLEELAQTYSWRKTR